MKKFVLLNGPPSSGKSLATDMILENSKEFYHHKMTSPMDMAFRSFFAIDQVDWNYYRELNKDKPQEIFGGHTTREALIAFSENFAKPLAGQSVFGRIAALHLRKIPNKHIVVSDTGFAHEVEPLIKEYGPENFILIRLHREGYDYGNDSRSYITFANTIKEVDIRNTNLASLRKDVLDAVDKFI